MGTETIYTRENKMSNFTALVFLIVMWGSVNLFVTSLTSNSVIVAIQDNGCTIPHEILDPILDKIVKERSNDQ